MSDLDLTQPPAPPASTASSPISLPLAGSKRTAPVLVWSAGVCPAVSLPRLATASR